jgi:hypothetical protein
MGVLTEYYRAVDDASALRALTNGPQAAGLPTVELKNTDPTVILGKFVAIVRKVEWSSDLTADKLISAESSDGPWITAIGNGARDTLAGVPTAEHTQLGAAWSGVEELGGMLSADDCRDMIAKLTSLAREAAAKDQRLYCWVCL